MQQNDRTLAAQVGVAHLSALGGDELRGVLAGRARAVVSDPQSMQQIWTVHKDDGADHLGVGWPLPSQGAVLRRDRHSVLGDGLYDHRHGWGQAAGGAPEHSLLQLPVLSCQLTAASAVLPAYTWAGGGVDGSFHLHSRLRSGL